MTSRGVSLKRRLALPVSVAVLVLTIALCIGIAVLGTARGASVPGVMAWGPPEIIFMLRALAFALAATVVAWRRPGNTMWLALALAAIAGAAFGFSSEWAIFALLRHAPALPAGDVAAWLATWTVQASPTALVLILFLFPSGSPASPRWGRMLWLLPACVVTGWVTAALLPASPWNLQPPGDAGPLRNPLAIRAAEPALTVLSHAGTAILSVALAVAILSLIARYRGAGADERQQLKLFLFSSLFVPVSYVGWPLYAGSGWLSPIGLVALLLAIVAVIGMPLGIGIAILKYRLYGIDIVISRTFVYASLAALITGVYVGIAVGIGAVVGSGGQPNLGLSIVATAVVAIGFQPARARLQRIANRLVYGRRATPYQVLSRFSSQVAGSYSPDEVLPRMARALQEGTAAESAAVWLRGGAELRAAAAWPKGAAAPGVLPSGDGAALPAIPGVTRAVAVEHRGELFGALAVTKRRGESLTPAEETLLDDLAHQAGLVLKNVGLTADLQRRLEELRLSRQRLVSAQDEVRRRLERNLHDGAQQNLVALKVKLRLAEMLSTKDPERARAALQELKVEADVALQTLRDLARGIYPPLLAEKGLAAALEAQARKATLPVTVEAEGINRHPEEMEATVYFCVIEALQNVQRYARASRAVVRLAEREGELYARVEDDGCGFDVASAKTGSGITNMHDRIDAAGGRLDIRSAMGRGTMVEVTIPVTPRVPVVACAAEHLGPTFGGGRAEN